MVLSFSQILVEYGSKLAVAGADSTALNDSLSSLDQVRKCAALNDNSRIDPPPPILCPDSFQPAEFDVFDMQPSVNTLFGAELKIDAMPDMAVVSGAMMQAGHVNFPVVILYSQTRKSLVLYARNAPLAALLSDLVTSAFSNDDKWTTLVCGKDAEHIMKCRQEAAVGTVTAGLAKTPSLVTSGNTLTVHQYGVCPFLSLRCVRNEIEFATVCREVAHVLKILPCASVETLNQARASREVATSVFMDNIPHLRGDNPLPETMDNASNLCKQGALTWVASLILHGANDHAFDANDESVSEYDTGMWHDPANEALYLEQVAKERTAIERARSAAPASDLEGFDPLGYTLPTVMSGLARPYTTKKIVDICDRRRCNTVHYATCVVEALFAPEDACEARRLTEGSILETTTLHTAISMIGTHLCESQAVLVALRSHDGRFEMVKLVGRNTRVDNVRPSLFSFLVLFPWVRVIIVDRHTVSELLTKNPNGIGQSQSFRLHRDAGPDVSLLQSIEVLKTEVGKLRGAPAADTGFLGQSVKRQLDSLIAFEKRLRV